MISKSGCTAAATAVDIRGKSVIRALMVDVDGVLVTGRVPDGSHWATNLENDLGLSFTELTTKFFRPYWSQIVIGAADLRQRLASVLAEIAPHLAAEELIRYWFQKDARLELKLLRELSLLRKAGLRVYLATNQEHHRARYLMEVLGLSASVDGCHYSAAIGHRKPNRAFFEVTAARVGLLPQELMLVDDTAENVRAAIAAGWLAHHWTGSGKLREILQAARL